MTQAQLIEGTTEEVSRQMQQHYAGQRVRVFIEPKDRDSLTTDLAAELPAPPFTVRSREQLVELLHEGMNNPVTEFSDDTLEQMRQEVRKRQAQRQA